MAKTEIKKWEVPTTNFILDLNKIDKTTLQENYQLLIIEMPDIYINSKDNQKYPKLHNAYKEQLELPYYFFSPKGVKPVIYILFEKENDKKKDVSLVFNFLNDKTNFETVVAQEKDILELCTDDNLHILAKLFLADYFYNYKKIYRICQGKFYIHSRQSGIWATVLEIGISKIKGTSEFYFDQKATFLVKEDKSKINTQYISSDFYCELLQGEKYYKQVKTSYVKTWQADKKETKELWKVISGTHKNSPSIKWFEDGNNITRCKSFLLQEFQEKLLNHCKEKLGTDCASQQIHTMEQVVPMTQFGTQTKSDISKKGSLEGYGFIIDNQGKKISTGLYLKLLNEVGLLDLRFKEVENINKIPFQKYVDFFNNYAKEKKYKINFSEITLSELENTKKPILVLQDVEKQLFQSEEKDDKDTIVKKAGFLFSNGFCDDPKPQLYNDFAKIVALQTMNVNTNEAEEHTINSYFQYEMLGDCLKGFGNSFVEIKENLNIEEKEIKKAYKTEEGNVSEETKERRKENEKLKKHFTLITNKIDVCLNELLLKYYLVHKLPIKNYLDNPNNSLPCLIKTPSLVNYAYMYEGFFMYVDNKNILQFIDLQDQKGKEQRNMLLDDWGIDWNKLDKEFSIRNYTREGENGEGNDKMYWKDKQQKSKHEKELRETHFIFSKSLILSIEDTNERVLHKYDPNKQGKSQRKGEHKTALEGIYFSNKKQIYTVGYKSLNQTAEHSVIVRDLHYYEKPDNFKIEDLLQTLSVQFVRNQQYTVYPYFFDLLNLYRKDILQRD